MRSWFSPCPKEYRILSSSTKYHDTEIERMCGFYCRSGWLRRELLQWSTKYIKSQILLLFLLYVENSSLVTQNDYSVTSMKCFLIFALDRVGNAIEFYLNSMSGVYYFPRISYVGIEALRFRFHSIHKILREYVNKDGTYEKEQKSLYKSEISFIR